MSDKTNYRKDTANKRIIVTRSFDAPPETVWRAWTEAELLDQWWGPKPWRAETKSMDFREGGSWLYSMAGPGGERHWAGMDYTRISTGTSYESRDYFCDEQGNRNTNMPQGMWQADFAPEGDGTTATVTLSFESVADMEQIIETGFEQGFAAAHTNLDELLKTMAA